MFWSKFPLLTVFRAPGAPKAHFGCIFNGLRIRRFQARVAGDPPKNTGGVRQLLGSRYPIFRIPGRRCTLCWTPVGVTGSHGEPPKKHSRVKKGSGGFFVRFCVPVCSPGSFYASRLPLFGLLALPPLVIPEARQVRSRGKALVGLGIRTGRKFFCAPRAPRWKRMFLPWAH